MVCIHVLFVLIFITIVITIMIVTAINLTTIITIIIIITNKCYCGGQYWSHSKNSSDTKPKVIGIAVFSKQTVMKRDNILSITVTFSIVKMEI